MVESHQLPGTAGSGSDSPRIVYAKPARTSRPHLMLVLLALVMGLAIALTNDGVVRWVFSPLLVVAPLLGFALRRRLVGNRPDRLEIRRDRVTAVVSTRGDARELSRADGTVLVVRGAAGSPYLSILGPGGRTGVIDISRFDVGEVGQAALDNGWAWQPPGSTVAIQPPPGWTETAEMQPAESTPATVIQLRDGHTRTVPKGWSPVLAVPILVIPAGGLGIALLSTTHPAWTVPAIVGMIVVMLGALLGTVFLLVRLSRVTITIGSDRLAVRYGSLSANIVQRAAIESGVAGKRWARLRDHRGKQLIRVPLRPRRDEVLAALSARGWPVRDDG